MKMLEKYLVCLVDVKGNELLKHNILALSTSDVKKKAKSLKKEFGKKNIHRVLIFTQPGLLIK